MLSLVERKRGTRIRGMTMAQFRGSMEGQRGSTSRLGSKKSGFNATINGWDWGIRVIATHVDGKDVFRVWRTGGSTGATPETLIAEIVERR